MALNRPFFFSTVREILFNKRLSQKQVDGMTAILDEWEAKHSKKDDRWLAYMLATTFHETARTMQPIDEGGGTAYFNRMYGPEGKNPANARKHGNTEPGDGARYHGRGFVQLTWKVNYKTMSKVTGVDLVAHPEKAKDLAVATKVMFHGMENGSFTGKKLGDYFKGETEEWTQARRIINKLDKAAEIAGYGRKFYQALSHTV